MKLTIRARLANRAALRGFFAGLGQVPDLGNKEVRKIAGAGRAGVGLNFTRQTSPDGEPWVPLAPMTQNIRKRGIDARGIPFRVAPKRPILVRTKDLRQSFENPNHPRNITHIARSGGRIQVSLGAQDDPATPDRIKTLHSGGKTPTGRIVPPRPFVGWSAPALERLHKSTVYVLDERAKRVK